MLAFLPSALAGEGARAEAKPSEGWVSGSRVARHRKPPLTRHPFAEPPSRPLPQGKRAHSLAPTLAALRHSGFSPRIATRRIRRRSLLLKSVRAWSVQRLSHISTSPTRQTCS